jgi:hypothetical protein
MTTFRSELIESSSLRYQFVSSNDPDLIGVEVSLSDNVLIDVSMNEQGLTSVLFDTEGGHFEFDLNDIRSVLNKCEIDLSAWRDRLCAPGEIWEDAR